MKTGKNLILPLFTIAFLSLMAACSSDLDFREDQFDIENQNIKMDEKSILKYVNNLNSSFLSNTRSDEGDQFSYPDYYGGIYVDDDRNIIVLSKKEESSVRDDLTRRMTTNKYLIKECDYSYNELQAAFEELTNFWLNDDNDEIFNSVSLVSFGINDITNRLQIDLLDCSDVNIQKFKQMIMDNPMLSFRKANSKIVMTASVYPGSQIANGKGSSASVGYRAMKSGVEGFLTVGHFVRVGDIVKMNGVEIGKCEASQFSGNLDAAWCKATNGYTPSRTTKMGTDLSTGTISTPAVGTYVNMEGFKSVLQRNKVTQATINGTFTYEDELGNEKKIKVSNLTQASYYCQKGDSGGVVYTDDGSLAGIQSGGSDPLNATQFAVSYFGKARYIQSALGIYLY